MKVWQIFLVDCNNFFHIIVFGMQKKNTKWNKKKYIWRRSHVERALLGQSLIEKCAALGSVLQLTTTIYSVCRLNILRQNNSANMLLDKCPARSAYSIKSKHATILTTTCLVQGVILNNLQRMCARIINLVFLRLRAPCP